MNPEERVAVAEIRHLLRLVFTSDKAVDEWLDCPRRELDFNTPRQLLAKSDGEHRVRMLIMRMVHGIPP